MESKDRTIKGKPVKGKTVLLAIGAWILGSSLLFTLGPYQTVKAAVAGSLPEEQFLGSYVQIAAQIDLLAANELGAYLTFQGVDVLNAALTAAAFLCIYRFLVPRVLGGRTRLAPLALLPLVLLGLELIENASIIISALASPDHSPALHLLIWSTSLKLLTGIALMLGAVVLALAWMGKGFMARRAGSPPEQVPPPVTSET